MKIPIKIDLGILDTYHLENLDLVYAVAELIDNSIGSYYRNKPSLDGPLVISIDCDQDHFSIKDNAGGISAADFGSALILGKSNTKSKIDNDFGVYGVGLKRSILWIGRTSEFNSDSLLDKMSHRLTYPQKDSNGNYLPETELKSSNLNGHSGLKITITDLHTDNVHGFNQVEIDKLKVNLGLIYYKFLETDEVFITINTEKLIMNKREILLDRYYEAYKPTGIKLKGQRYCLRDHQSKKIEWKLPVNYDKGKYSITGWLGIRKGSSKSGMGIYVFRDKRGILGIPPAIEYNPYNLSIGNSNYQRLIGEIEIIGFKKPTMGNALPEKNILNQLLIDFKQDITFNRLRPKEELLAKFYKQLDNHLVDMIDSRPCQEASLPSKQPNIPYSPVTTTKEDHHPLSTNLADIRPPYLQEEHAPETKTFSITINSVLFEISITQALRNNVEYHIEENVYIINIQCQTDLSTSYLRLLAQYIHLFETANPILNQNMEILNSILPQ